MSSGEPPLPDSADPAELLGLSEDATLRDLKQAYARLIKIYRPERAPQEFQRIHAAFEALRQALTGGYGHLPQRVFRRQEAPQPEPELVQERALGEQASEDSAGDPAQAYAHGFQELLAAGAGVDELAGYWLRGLQRDLDLVDAMFELSPPQVLEQLATNGSFAWSRLEARRFGFRGALWTLHAQAALEQRRCQELLQEADSASFREAADSDEHLREALWLPLTVAAWEQPASSFERFAWALDAAALSPGAKTFHQACQLQSSLALVRSWRWVPAGFLELIRLGRVSPKLRHELLLALEASLESEPEHWWRLCRELGDRQRLLGFYLLGTLSLAELTREQPVGALTRQQRELLQLAIDDARVSPGTLTHGALSLAFGLSMLALVVALLVLAFRGYQAVFGDGAGSPLLPVLELALGLLVAMFVLGGLSSNSENAHACRVLRRDLPGYGIGYQQLVDSIDSQRQVKPSDLQTNAALKLYLTLRLAFQRSRWAEARRSGASTSSTS